MPHPNPPAKQNLDKKGLLTISNSAYCNFTWYMGRGRGGGEATSLYVFPPAIIACYIAITVLFKLYAPVLSPVISDC